MDTALCTDTSFTGMKCAEFIQTCLLLPKTPDGSVSLPTPQGPRTPAHAAGSRYPLPTQPGPRTPARPLSARVASGTLGLPGWPARMRGR